MTISKSYIATFYIILCLLFYFQTNVLAQKGKHGHKTISTNNTIVNEYTHLVADVVAGATSLTVDNSQMNSNNRFTSALQAGDLIMIIQVQGAASSSYEFNGFGFPLDNTWGEISNYNSCGLYELLQVASVPNNTTINIECGLQNSYSTLGKTQIIRMPRYQSLNITNGGVVTAENWNGNRGGVVAIEVAENTIIQAGGSINATGKGFRGGELDNSFLWGGGQWAAINAIEGAEKGESILGYKNDYNIYGGRYCRGAPANGGGGGNTHNSGGGGGANGGVISSWNGLGNPDISVPSWINAWNLESPGFAFNTSSGGGRGGYSFSDTDLDALTIGPNDSLWGGDRRRNNGGLGGRPLLYATGRLFLGGGGGAGEQNNNYGGAGGEGGGLVFLYGHGAVSGDGQIIANGNAGQNSSSPWSILGYTSDGAGGGGGGGTVVLNMIGTVSGITIRANGGKGGDQNLISNNKVEGQGPGGGGGGGYIAISNGSPTREAIGGHNGTTNSSSLTEFIPNGATKGGLGTNNASVSNYQIIVTNDTICSNTSTVLNASIVGSSPPNFTINWYDSDVGGTVLGTGNVFTTPILNTTTTYYVGICPGFYREPVTVVVANASFSAGTNTTLCVGNQVTLNASGGVSYQWSPSTGLNNTNIANPIANPTITTTYTATITNALGCSGTDAVVVQVNYTSVQTLGDTSICQGGQAHIHAYGGIQFAWSHGTSLNNSSIANPIATPTITTTYTVTVINSSGCEGTEQVIVNVLAPPQIQISSNNSICLGDSIALSASGGSAYLWAPTNTLSQSNISNPLAFPSQTTTYVVTVTDIIGCTAADSVVINVGFVNLSVSNDTSMCAGNTIQLFANGGVNYTWTPAQSLNNAQIPNPMASPLISTTYTVEASDNNGCSASAHVKITITASVQAGFNYNGSCVGDSTTFFDISTDYFGLIDNWQWDFGNGMQANGVKSPAILYIQSGSFPVTLIVSNTLGCTDTITQLVPVYDKPQVAFTASPIMSCAPVLINFTNHTQNNNNSFEWDFGDNSTAISTNPTHAYHTPNTYQITLKETNAQGCSNSANETIYVYPTPQAEFYATPNIGFTGASIYFTDMSLAATEWIWYFNDGHTSIVQNPIHAFANSGIYQVQLIAKNSYNCADTISHQVVIEEDVTIYVPNAFSPDGDGINDLFGPQGIGLNNEHFEFYIYDRWGKNIFFTKDAQDHWNGYAMNGERCPKGVYTWVILIQKMDGRTHTYRYTGIVTML